MVEHRICTAEMAVRFCLSPPHCPILGQLLYSGNVTTYFVQGIVIKRRDLGESDRLITILTKEKGKITAIARGSRKAKSKLKGYLELFRYDYFNLAVGKVFDIITAAETLETFDGFSRSLKKLSLASYCIEVTDRLVGEREPLEAVFDLLLESLRFLKKNSRHLDLLPSYFILSLGSLLGFQPEFYRSVASDKKLAMNDELFYSAQGGGLLSAKEAASEMDAFSVSHKAVKVLRLLTESAPGVLVQLKLDPATTDEVKKVAAAFSELILEEKPKSESLLSD